MSSSEWSRSHAEVIIKAKSKEKLSRKLFLCLETGIAHAGKYGGKGCELGSSRGKLVGKAQPSNKDSHWGKDPFWLCRGKRTSPV